MKYFVGLLWLSIVLLHISCNKQATCLQDARIITNIKFTRYNDTLAIIDTALPKPNLTSLGIGFTGTENTKTFSFLLNSITDSMDISFTTNSEMLPVKYDTIHVVYDRQLHFISKECGFNQHFTLRSATTTNHTIKKVTILQPLINDNNNNVPHLSFLF